MAITDWPTDDRPREKLLQRGADTLSDAELLAIFLRTGIQGCSAVDLARHLLSSFGSLRMLLTASHTEFCKHKGLGNAKYAQLQAVLEMANRHLSESIKRTDYFTSPADTMAYLKRQLRDQPHEIFACLMLDNHNRLIAFRELFRGTIDGAAVYPREVVKQALADNAACIIFAHNHPSGVCEPSQADIQITRRLKEALALVDIRVLDHVIVGENSLCFSERGLI